MAVQTQRMTVEEFERFSELPENAARRLELIEGEVVEVVSNSYSSLVAAQVLIALGAFVNRHRLGYVTGADGGYKVTEKECFMPDVGFISKDRLSEPPHETWIPFAPDLAVEVLSPTDDPENARTNKVVKYLAAGAVVWLVDPDRKWVEIYIPGPAVKRLGVGDTLDGGDVLPGFMLAVKDIFPE
jgi:Uma2 family endonuclease